MLRPSSTWSPCRRSTFRCRPLQAKRQSGSTAQIARRRRPRLGASVRLEDLAECFQKSVIFWSRSDRHSNVLLHATSATVEAPHQDPALLELAEHILGWLG